MESPFLAKVIMAFVGRSTQEKRSSRSADPKKGDDKVGARVCPTVLFLLEKIIFNFCSSNCFGLKL
jgi:hypothetical protein